jgi:predicted Zn-dependent peptidase
MNLRERRGFSYGVRSGFSFNRQAGPFVASGGVTTAKTDSSVREFVYEIGRMHKEGITAGELSFAKKGMTGNFALGFETPAQIAGALQNVVLYNLPENYYDTYLAQIDKVSLDEIQSAARKYLDSSKMAVVVVGDLSVVKNGVNLLRLGETVVCDVEGNPVTP